MSTWTSGVGPRGCRRGTRGKGGTRKSGQEPGRPDPEGGGTRVWFRSSPLCCPGDSSPNDTRSRSVTHPPRPAPTSPCRHLRLVRGGGTHRVRSRRPGGRWELGVSTRRKEKRFGEGLLTGDPSVAFTGRRPGSPDSVDPMTVSHLVPDPDSGEDSEVGTRRRTPPPPRVRLSGGGLQKKNPAQKSQNLRSPTPFFLLLPRVGPRRWGTDKGVRDRSREWSRNPRKNYPNRENPRNRGYSRSLRRQALRRPKHDLESESRPSRGPTSLFSSTPLERVDLRNGNPGVGLGPGTDMDSGATTGPPTVPTQPPPAVRRRPRHAGAGPSPSPGRTTSTPRRDCRGGPGSQWWCVALSAPLPRPTSISSGTTTVVGVRATGGV